MNNEIIRLAEIDPSKINGPSINYERANLLRIALISHSSEKIIFVINIIVCLATMKRIKQNKSLFLCSIVITVFSSVGKTILSYEGRRASDNSDLIIMITTFIIQLIISIKLIINILKNRKKEEP